MFLDDQLIEIGTSRGIIPKHWRDKGDVIKKMIVAVNHYMQKQSSDGQISMGEFQVAIKRAKQHWRNAVNKMKKQGLTWINPEGLVLDYEIKGKKIDLKIDYENNQ